MTSASWQELALLPRIKSKDQSTWAITLLLHDQSESNLSSTSVAYLSSTGETPATSWKKNSVAPSAQSSLSPLLQPSPNVLTMVDSLMSCLLVWKGTNVSFHRITCSWTAKTRTRTSSVFVLVCPYRWSQTLSAKKTHLCSPKMSTLCCPIP